MFSYVITLKPLYSAYYFYSFFKNWIKYIQMKGKIFKRDTDYYFLRKFKDDVYGKHFLWYKEQL